MKNIFLSIAASIGFAISAVAQNSNNLIVFSKNRRETFYLVLNGQKYNEAPQTNVRVTNLLAPNYKAIILFDNGQPQFEANVYFMSGGAPVTNKEFTYEITTNKDGKYKLKFISQADLVSPTTYAANGTNYNPNGCGDANQCKWRFYQRYHHRSCYYQRAPQPGVSVSVGGLGLGNECKCRRCGQHTNHHYHQLRRQCATFFKQRRLYAYERRQL